MITDKCGIFLIFILVTIKDLIELDSLGANFAKDWVCIGHL